MRGQCMVGARLGQSMQGVGWCQGEEWRGTGVVGNVGGSMEERGLWAGVGEETNVAQGRR